MLILDTYALVEIRSENPKFEHILNSDFAITDFTIGEFYILLMKEFGEADARYWYRKLLPYCVSIDRETIIKSLKFREENKKRRISVFDAIGYIYARENHAKFVTGDKEFEKLPGVEFIKK